VKPVSLAVRVACLSMLLGACGGENPAPQQPTPPSPSTTASQVGTVESPDPLGPQPTVAAAAPFVPPAPQVFTAASGITVWLLERHQVPLVSCDIHVPTGASSDPKDKAGLAYATANMMDEGAGTRGAIDLARAIDDLGAQIGTDANADASFVTVTVLKRNLDKAFALFGDVVARPRMDAVEFKRVKDLWANELREREKDPDATARVVYRVALYGPDHPYGHPWDGTPKSAKAITLDDVRAFYKSSWRPDRATLVCVGDIDKAGLSSLMDSAFGAWKAPATPVPAPVVPPAPTGPWPRLVLVDRPEAPQSVVAMVKVGIAAASPDKAPLWRANNVIGGSFTSRLNQDLREAHGYTYGAHTRYSTSRGTGQMVAYAAVRTDVTGEALGAMLADLKKFATEGLAPDEVDRSRSQARGELVSAYESDEAIAGRLAAGASLGLSPDFEGKESQLRDAAPKADLDRVAKQYLDPDGAIIVVVGPKARVQSQIDKLGLPAPEMRDAQGNVLK
jgi:zinc protease